MLLEPQKSIKKMKKTKRESKKKTKLYEGKRNIINENFSLNKLNLLIRKITHNYFRGFIAKYNVIMKTRLPKN